MKRINSLKWLLTFIFALLLFAAEAQKGISHYQIDEPGVGTSDSVLFFVKTGNYWSMVKGVMDTSKIEGLRDYIELIAPEQDLSSYSTKTQLDDSTAQVRSEIPAFLTQLDSAGFRLDYTQIFNEPVLSQFATRTDVGDTANVLRSEFPVYLVDLDSAGFTITESQISDLQDYLTNSDFSGLRDSTLANTGKDTTGIYHANRALLDAITVNDTTRWGEQPEFLTDLDSTNFDIDTTQVRNLKTFVENNSGETSISGTAGYIPKFGVSGLTESGVFEDGSGNVGVGTTSPTEKLDVNGRISTSSSSGNLVFDGNLLSGVSTIQFNSPNETTSQIWIDPMTPNGTEYSLFRIFRNVNTTGLATVEILAADNTSSVQSRLAANSNSYLNAITGNVGIGTTTPTVKLEVNGNIKANMANFNNRVDVSYDNGAGIYLEGVDYRNGLSILSTSNGSFLQNPVNAGLIFEYSVVGSQSRVGILGGYQTAAYYFTNLDGTSGQVLTTDGSGNTYWSDGGGGGGSGDITGVVAGTLLDGGGTVGDVTLNVDLSEATSDNTFSSTDELIYLSGTSHKRGSVSGLQSYMQSNLNFGNVDLSSLTVNNNLLGSTDHLVYVNSSDGVSYRISPSHLGNHLSNYIQLQDLSDVPSPTANYYLKRNSAGTGYEWVAGTGSVGTDIDVVQQDYNVEIKSSTGSNDIIYSATSTEAGVMSKNDKVHLDAAYGWGDHSTKGYLIDAPSNGSLYGRKDGAWTVISTGTSAVTSVNAGSLIDVNSTTGDVTVNVDLSEATSDNTFSSTDEVVYLSGTTQKRGTVSGLESYMQSNLDFGGATNLSTSYSSTNVIVNSDTGDDATINAATTSNAGVMSAADKVKVNYLDGTGDGTLFLSDDGTYSTPPSSGGVGTSSNTELLYNNSGSVGGASYIRNISGQLVLGNEDEFIYDPNVIGLVLGNKRWANSHSNTANGFIMSENYYGSGTTLMGYSQTRLELGAHVVLMGKVYLNIYDITTNERQNVEYDVFVYSGNGGSNVTGEATLVSRTGTTNWNASISCSYNSPTNDILINYYNYYNSASDTIVMGVNLVLSIMKTNE